MSSKRTGLITQSCSGKVVQGAFMPDIKESQSAVANRQCEDAESRRAVKRQRKEVGQQIDPGLVQCHGPGPDVEDRPGEIPPDMDKPGLSSILATRKARWQAGEEGPRSSSN